MMRKDRRSWKDFACYVVRILIQRDIDHARFCTWASVASGGFRWGKIVHIGYRGRELSGSLSFSLSLSFGWRLVVAIDWSPRDDNPSEANPRGLSTSRANPLTNVAKKNKKKNLTSSSRQNRLGRRCERERGWLFLLRLIDLDSKWNCDLVDRKQYCTKNVFCTILNNYY